MQNHSTLVIVLLFWLICNCWLAIWPMIRVWWPTEQAVQSSETKIPGQTKASKCPACESERESSPPEPPPRIEQKRGRKRSVDTSIHYCPKDECLYFGWVGLGNIQANGHPNSGRWRQLKCTICRKTFMETINTIFYRKQVPAEIIWMVLKSLAEGVGIRKTARIFDLDPNTVNTWLHQAARHMEAVSYHLIYNLHLEQVQVDEMWALLGTRDIDRQKKRAKRWVWVGTDAVSKLWLATVVGDRSQVCAQLLIHAIKVLLAPGCLPLFISDAWSAYGTALLTHFGHFVPVPRRHHRGAPPKPRWQPLPGLLYAQVVKERVKGRVVSVTHRAVYGSLEVIQATIKRIGVGNIVNTAFIERLNLSIRQHVAALARKVLSLAKSEIGLKAQLSLSQNYYNFCLPHSSLRLPLPEPLPTKGIGSPKKWRQRTPAMAADVTDRIWRMEELLLFRVPPWQQDVPAAS